jgi:TPR repeat protein
MIQGIGGCEKDPVGAVDWLTKAAEKGCAVALFRLGESFFEGVGGKRDYERGLTLLRAASARGNIPATRKLGYCYEKGIGVAEDLTTARLLYELGIALGDEIAQGMLRDVKTKIAMRDPSPHIQNFSQPPVPKPGQASLHKSSGPSRRQVHLKPAGH